MQSMVIIQLLASSARKLKRAMITRPLPCWSAPTAVPRPAIDSMLLEHLRAYNRHYQRRDFHSSAVNDKHQKCPHTILGVSKNAEMADIKRSFIQLALEHHPDTSPPSTTSSSSPERFIQIRQAFEELVGKQASKDKSATATATPNGWSSDELKDWWKHQDEAATKDFLTFEMSDATRQEVIKVYRTMSAGGKDKGGYWDMARQLAEREAYSDDTVDDEADPTRLLPANDNTGARRRRRKR